MKHGVLSVRGCLRRVDQSPEQFGVSVAHVRRVDRMMVDAEAECERREMASERREREG